MAIKLANNLATTLQTGITAADATLQVAAGYAVNFPALGAGDVFFLTLQDATNIEVVEVTAVNTDTDTLSVLRGRDDTLARPFAAGATVAMRVTAEVLRRLTPDAIMGEPNGLATLDVNAKLPAVQLPDEAVTQTEGDARYVQLATKGAANGVAPLGADNKVPGAHLPAGLMTTTAADARYVQESTVGEANGVAPLDANGKVPASHLPITQQDLTAYARTDAAETFDSDVTVAGKVQANTLQAGVTVLGNTTTDTLEADVLIVAGGARRGKLTLSLNPPSGVPADGDEWVQYQ